MIRPARVVAIARRDLAQELKGRRGWVLPAIMAGLLLPVSGAPRFALPAPEEAPPQVVSGAVPEAIEALPGIRVADSAGIIFEQGEQLTVRADWIPPDVREELDGPRPDVVLELVPRVFPVPGRSLLFALISASTLTGAVSTSIAGERTHRTLVSLLAAAVTRFEVICGKFLAWGGLGAATSMLAALVAVALDRITLGWWMIPMMTVPLGTVALGLFLVRRAADIIGGTTVSLRVLPAVLGLSGIMAWFIGLSSPSGAALIPLGGALMAAGSTWGTAPGPALLAAASTLVFTLGLLTWTARDLEEVVRPGRGITPRALAGWTILAGAVIWQTPIVGPLLWSYAGNSVLLAQLPAAAGITAGGFGLLLATFVRAARVPSVATDLGADRSPGALGWALAVGAGILLVGLTLAPVPAIPLPGSARLSAALVPTWAGISSLLLCIAADELIFRGWLLRSSGPAAAIIAWWLVKTPLDPITGIVSGALLVGVVHAGSGSVFAAVATRLIWAALLLFLV